MAVLRALVGMPTPSASIANDGCRSNPRRRPNRGEFCGLVRGRIWSSATPSSSALLNRWTPPPAPISNCTPSFLGLCAAALPAARTRMAPMETASTARAFLPGISRMVRHYIRFGLTSKCHHPSGARLNTCSAPTVQAISLPLDDGVSSAPQHRIWRTNDDPSRCSAVHRHDFDDLDAGGPRGRRRRKMYDRDQGRLADGEGVRQGRSGRGEEDDERNGQAGEGGWSEVHLRWLPQGPRQLRADQERGGRLQEARSRS